MRGRGLNAEFRNAKHGPLAQMIVILSPHAAYRRTRDA
jgi:hypothetical protein